jgi:hypothetical protein
MNYSVQSRCWRVALVSVLIQGICWADGLFKLPITAQNHRLRFTVSHVATQDHYGDTTAPEGQIFVVCTGTWENVIDKAFAAERNLPDRALDDNLAESLSLTTSEGLTVPAAAREPDTAHLDANDHDVVGHSGGATDAAYIRKVVGYVDEHGQRSIVYIDLDHPGDKKSGDVVFLAPVAGGRPVQLAYDDPLGGEFTLNLLNEAIKPSGVPEPAAPKIKKNDIFAIAAEATRVAPDLLEVSVTAKSLMTERIARPVYDPAFVADEEYNRTVATDFAEFAQSTQLVADGTQPCPRKDVSDATASITIQAKQWTRYPFRFKVPPTAKSFDLTLYFNSYTVPGHDGDDQPPPLVFHLMGPTAKKADVPAHPEAKVDDEELKFYILSHRNATEFAGQKADPEQQFLIVDWFIDNPTDSIEEFKSPEQLVWFDQDQETAPNDVTAQGPFAPPPFFDLSPHQSRTFETVWVVPAKLKQAAMGLKGNHVAQRFNLPLTATQSP